MNSEASSESPFHLQPDKPGFEALANDNSFRFWWASELAVILGYESLNNMDLWRLRRHKGVLPGRSPLDFMGKTELAANLFRVTQTEEKIRGERIRGQKPLERTAEDVGREVRRTMVKISGRRPEELPAAEDIKEVHKKLKSSHLENENRLHSGSL